jgi:ATP-dependent DNA helicase PIF1
MMTTKATTAKASPLIITDEFQRCLAEVNGGANLFITGKAGTGKSTLLRLIRKQNEGKEIVVVAPTGVAALNVDGATIHRYFGFRPDLTPDLRRYRAPEYLAAIDILLIDEVSMVRADLMDMVSKSLQRARESREPFGGAQVVMIGDLFQLPPVTEDEPRDTYYATEFFFSSKAFLESQITTIELTHVFRQKDQVFIEVLNAIRDGSFTAAHLETLNRRYDAEYQHSYVSVAGAERDRSMTIATKRDYVRDINQRHLDGLDGSPRVYVATREGEIEKKVFEDLRELHLKPGAQVMMLVNQDGYANGTVGEVLDLAPDVVTIYIPEIGEAKEVRRYVWEILKPVRKNGRVEKEVVGRFTQFPMQLAWAVTVHKSQGKTFDRVVFDCASIFEDGQTYVALSRCTSLGGLTLTQPIEARHVKVSPAVRRFYRAATRPKASLQSGPVAFVGLHTTGLDKFRKLVEMAAIRVEGRTEVLRLSTLIAPGRDASDAAAVGINASDLTMCPSVAEARDLFALALDGASLVGKRVHDLIALIGWPDEAVDEGVPYEMADIPYENGDQPTAMDLAERAADEFCQLGAAHRRGIQTAPFRFLKRTIDPGSYVCSRSLLGGLDHLFRSNTFAALENSAKPDAVLGFATAMIMSGTKAELVQAQQMISAARISAAQAEVLRESLLCKANKDRRVSADEVSVLKRFCETTGVVMDAISETDSRLRTTFRRGMKIYLSGGPGKAGTRCEGLSKADVEARCEHTGLVIVTSDMRKKDGYDAVVVADLSTEGKTRAKAERWEIPVMCWEELLDWAEEQNHDCG